MPKMSSVGRMGVRFVMLLYFLAAVTLHQAETVDLEAGLDAARAESWECSAESTSKDDPTATSQSPPAEESSASRRLDIVLTHYQQERLNELQVFWPNFIANEKVAVLRPHVFVYCHSDHIVERDSLEPLFKHGGDVVPQDNFGREVGGFLEHIVRHWDDLADHTLFSQDLPEPMLAPRFLRMFDAASTGFLPLAVYGVVSCDDIFIPHALIPQLYTMFTGELCPPQGYSAGFNGEFVVSRQRIQRNDWQTYHYLLDLAGAASDHWIHYSERPWQTGDRSNPMFAHLMERTWSLAFDCYDPWRMQDCWQCNNEDCDLDHCQCLDSEVVA